MAYGTALGAERSGAATSAQTTMVAPRTIASAIGRMEHLNERLSIMRNAVTDIATQIGGPFPTNGISPDKQTQPMGAVAHLNDVADAAHNVLDDVEQLLKSIANSLG